MDVAEDGENHSEIIQEKTLVVVQILMQLMDLLSEQIPKSPQPYHTSSLSGEGWVVELILGHPDHIRCELGMDAHTFKEVTLELHSHGHKCSTNVSLKEQLAIFLYMCVTSLPIRHIRERFQRSNDTISRYVCTLIYSLSDVSMFRYFHKMVKIFASELFYLKYILLASSTTDVHPNIVNNYRFFPYFKDAIGAIDGSHIPASPPLHDCAAYHNQKGTVSQNCLFACDFDMKFTYVLTGREGSATDARIFQDVWLSSLDIPQGKYFLGDAGFPSSTGVIVPYHNTCYHLAEWHQASLR